MKVVLTLALAGILGGCASADSAVNAAWYVSAKKGVATNGSVKGKTGVACATSILGLIGTGDASIRTAAKNGGIEKINNVDSEATQILGFFAKYCTHVTGE